MNINDYIAHHRMQRLDTASRAAPGFVPSSLAQKFTLDDDVEYFVDWAKQRWVGICRNVISSQLPT